MEHSTPQIYTEFLPISRADMEARGWEQLDFVVVGGDAYVDHPSFGTAIISRLLEAEGYKVGVLAQPRYTDCEDFKRFGKPKYGFFIGGGNVDSMVSHYSVAKIPRAEDEYSPGGKAGARPDRSATVYTKLAKQAYPDLPVILGGLEASLRRFAHYDYWLDTVLPSIAEDSGADLISFGMGEHQTVEIARRLAAGEPVETITDVNGTCYLTDFDHLPQRYVECAGFKKVASDKTAYAKACRIQMDNQDVVSGQIIVQKQSEKYLVQNIPAKPLVRGELDKVYALPYTRRYHPIYESMGGVPAIREVQFSIIQNRGCFGGCNFCAIQLHQGRRVTSRSADSIVEEAERMTHEPDFKGYIHDVGGPTANFRFPSCREQMLRGMCTGGKHCLAPTTCSHMIVDHSDYLKILRRVRELPGVKKVFIRSGIRFDYLMADPDDTFFKELVEYHVSGQLKVAPEHCAPNTLAYMGKPPIETFNKFKDKFYELSKKAGKKQYLVPYLMSSHPGSTLKDAVYLAEYAKQGKIVDIIRFAADALASVPSIVMGLFGYALFVEAMGLGLSMVSAALALALLMLPIVMRTTEEAIRAVPRYIRWGAYGLGATKWQVVSKVVLPSAFGRIATGIVLAIGRAIGETAVVLYTMGQAINLPISPLDSGRPMTVHLYLLANDGINMNAAYGTALLLMAIILAFNLFARYLSRKRR